VPQRFYVSQQTRSGDRHVYGSLTRFIPPTVADLFEQVGPARSDVSGPAALAGLQGVKLDIQSSTASFWGAGSSSS